MPPHPTTRTILRKFEVGRVLCLVFVAHHLLLGALIIGAGTQTAFAFVTLSTSGIWAVLALFAGCSSMTKGVSLWHRTAGGDSETMKGAPDARAFVAAQKNWFLPMGIGQMLIGAALTWGEVHPGLGLWSLLGGIACLGYLTALFLALPPRSKASRSDFRATSVPRLPHIGTRARREARRTRWREAVFAGVLLSVFTHKLIPTLMSVPQPQTPLTTGLFFASMMAILILGTFGWGFLRQRKADLF